MDAERSPGKRALSARQQAEVIASVHDPFARRSLRVAYHLRRYSVIYVVGALAVLALALLPTVGRDSSTLANGAGPSTGGAYGTPAPGASGGALPAAPGAAPNGAVPGGATAGAAGGPGGAASVTGPAPDESHGDRMSLRLGAVGGSTGRMPGWAERGERIVVRAT